MPITQEKVAMSYLEKSKSAHNQEE
jgi:hypothetical protein